MFRIKNAVRSKGKGAVSAVARAMHNAQKIFSWKAKLKNMKLGEMTLEQIKKIALNEPAMFSLATSEKKDADEHKVAIEVKDSFPQKRIIKRAILGCAGSGPGKGNKKSPQEAVAELMDQLIAAAAEKPDCIIILGDNFYPAGVTSAYDEKFKTHFYDIYYKQSLPALQNIPTVLVLGNHCVNLRTESGRVAGNGDEDKAFAQLLHTFVYNPTPEMLLPTQEQKEVKEFKRSEESKQSEKPVPPTISLDLQKLPAFNMPRAYFGFVTEGNTKKDEGCFLELFANWNTIARDYLKSLDKEDPNNQINFFKAQFKKYQEKYGNRLATVLYMHGPLSVHDKGLAEDPRHKLKLYLSDDEIARFRERGFKGVHFNDLIREIFQAIGVELDVACSADTHAMFNYLSPPDENGKRLYQVCAGAGGNPSLQYKHDGKHLENLHFMSTPGVVMLTTDLRDHKKRMLVDYHSTPIAELETAVHMQFDQYSAAPILSENAGLRIKRLRELVAKARRDYFAELTRKSVVIHNPKVDVKHVDDLFHAFFQREELNFDAAIRLLLAYYRVHQGNLKHEHSFISKLNSVFQSELGIQLWDFLESRSRAEAALLMGSSAKLLRVLQANGSVDVVPSGEQKAEEKSALSGVSMVVSKQDFAAAVSEGGLSETYYEGARRQSLAG